MTEKRTLRLPEVAEILGYHPVTVSKLHRDGVLTAEASGRGGALHFPEAEVLEYRDKVNGDGEWCHTEVAARLAFVSVTTIVDAINAGELDAERVGKRWVMRRSAAMDWAFARYPDLVQRWNERARQENKAAALERLRDYDPATLAAVFEAAREVSPALAEDLERLADWNRGQADGLSPAMRFYGKDYRRVETDEDEQ